jgi:hypothetical protein
MKSFFATDSAQECLPVDVVAAAISVLAQKNCTEQETKQATLRKKTPTFHFTSTKTIRFNDIAAAVAKQLNFEIKRPQSSPPSLCEHLATPI